MVSRNAATRRVRDCDRAPRQIARSCIHFFPVLVRSADEIFLGIIAWDVRRLEPASFPSAISWRTRPQPACSLAHVFHREKDGFPCAGDGFEMMNSLGVRPRSKPRDIS